MPIRPQPITYTCRSCRWSKTVAPRSDALMPSEFFSACPVCQHTSLDRKAATMGEAVLGSLNEALKRTW